jgi:hypothetical protein
MSLLKRPEEGKSEQQLPEPAGNEIISTGDTTKRHRNTAHNRSSSIATTITEEVEEDDESPSKPPLDRAPTVKKEGGLARSDTVKPQPAPEAEAETEAANDSVVVEEPSAEDSKQAGDSAESKPEDKDAEEEEAEITIIEAEVPADVEGPGESDAVIPEETTAAETVAEK